VVLISNVWLVFSNNTHLRWVSYLGTTIAVPGIASYDSDVL
jgi:hypothetical protein